MSGLGKDGVLWPKSNLIRLFLSSPRADKTPPAAGQDKWKSSRMERVDSRRKAMFVKVKVQSSSRVR